MKRRLSDQRMRPSLPFDPISRSAESEALVMQGDRRLYYRFLSSGHYGGIVTADGAAFPYQLNAVRELRRRGGIYRIAAMAGAVNSRLLIRIFPHEEIEWEEFSNFGTAERNLADRGVRLDVH